MATAVGVAVVPAAALQSQTLYAFRPGAFVNALLIVSAFSLIVLAVSMLATHNFAISARNAALLTLLMFWWVELSRISLRISDPIPWLSVNVVAVAIAAGLTAGVIRWGMTWIVALTLLSLCLGLAVAHTAEIATTKVTPQAVGSIVTQGSPSPDRPNVFVLMLDGAPRSDTLLEFYGASDAGFVEALESLGADVKDDGWSNYNRTYASVSSMLALDTIASPDQTRSRMWPEIRGVSGGDGEFLRAFADAGYTIVYSPSAWDGSRCDDIVDECVTFRLTTSNLYWLMRRTIFAPLVPSVLQHPWTSVSDAQLGAVATMYEDSMVGGEPFIVWMHAALPHPPLAFDADCTERRSVWRDTFVLTNGDEYDAMRVAAFAEQHECTNERVADQLSLITDLDPHAVLLVVSDHGPESLDQHTTDIAQYDAAQTRERMAVVTALRSPERCAAALDGQTTVHVFRAVVRCILGATVQEPPAASYLAPTETGFERGEPLIEVTPQQPILPLGSRTSG